MQTTNAQPEALSRTGLMDLVEALETAKRQAAASFTRMGAHPSPQDAALTTRDEQAVLCARVGVLNALLRQPAGAKPLCLEASGRKAPRVCATYDRLRCEGELELGPMQSTMAWAVHGAEDAVLQLMSAPDGQSPQVKGLLDLVQRSAPRKDILQGLRAALSLPPPERLVLKSLPGADGRTYEGLGEAAGGPVPPLYRVVWGALSLDVLEGWQNPSTNAAIRLSILDAAQQAAREAQQTKAAAWSNVAHLQIRVYHDGECHRLSLRPFWDSESCTVSHVQFRQSVFDDSGPERGLLNLGQDPGSIHPIPMGRIRPLEAFVCLGAHRKSRLSEAQLNYVHAQGLLAHGFDPALLPDPGRLLQVQPGRMPPAKATRVSGDKLDVMASSYHIADQVYTTITVVQYPPFGTQFEKPARRSVNMPRPLGMDWGGQPEPARRSVNMPRPLGMDWGDQPSDEEPGGWETIPVPDDDAPDAVWEEYQRKVSEAVEHDPSESAASRPDTPVERPARRWEPRQAAPSRTGWSTHEYGRPRSGKLRKGRDPAERSTAPREHPTDEPLYKMERDFAEDSRPRSLAESKASARPQNWTFALRKGEHYFVDGVVGDPYNLRQRFVLFELDDGMRFRHAEATATRIKGFFREHRSDVFLSAYPFYWNISQNRNITVPGQHTLAQTWQDQWQDHIRSDLNPLVDEIHETGGRPKWFWCTEDQSGWDKIVQPGSSVSFYPEFSRTYYNRLIHEGRIQSHFPGDGRALLAPRLANPDLANPDLLAPRLANQDQIPLPPRQARPDQAVGQLQMRIAALESRLGRIKQDGNTQALLTRVLERLEDDDA